MIGTSQAHNTLVILLAKSQNGTDHVKS